MNLSGLITTCIILAYALCGCTTGSNPAPVPKPEAYPRIADPGTNYVAVDSLPIVIVANSAADVSRPASMWLNFTYPTLKAVVHISITPVTPDDISDILANRTQRMALNLPDRADAEESTLTSEGGFNTLMLSSPEARSTPLQFLAHDGRSWVVSGVAFFPEVTPDAPIDSLAPAVGFIKRDLIRLLTSLSVK